VRDGLVTNAVRNRPTIYVMVGLPCAGKTVRPGAAGQEFLGVKPWAAAQIQDGQAGHRTEHGKHGRPIVVRVERPVACVR
jgi:hypothetical protein